MSEVERCELEQELTEEYFLDMCEFLESVQLNPIEAQILLIVFDYPEYYIPFPRLGKKIPKELRKQAFDLKGSTMRLIKPLTYLQIYESKKDVLCFRCTPFGNDIAKIMKERCYSLTLRHFYKMEQDYSSKKSRLLCVDHMDFKAGQTRTSRGPQGEKLEVFVKKIEPSDNIFRKREDGTPVYERKLIGEIRNCPRCSEKIPIEYCYNPTSLYEYVQVQCKNCGLKFELARYILKFRY